jgi:hypothetical protein
MADAFFGDHRRLGEWNTASNWFDISTGTAASGAPGAADFARIDGPLTGSITVA